VVYRYVADEADSHLNFIFTNFLLHQERDIRVYRKVMEVAKKRNATFIPVKLTCDVEVIKERIASEDRVLNLKMTDVKLLDNLIKNGPPLINLEHPNALTVDVTYLSPRAAKERVVEWVRTVLINARTPHLEGCRGGV